MSNPADRGRGMSTAGEVVTLTGTSFSWRVRADETTGALVVWLAGSGTVAVTPDRTRNGVVLRRLVNGQIDQGRKPKIRSFT